LTLWALNSFSVYQCCRASAISRNVRFCYVLRLLLDMRRAYHLIAATTSGSSSENDFCPSHFPITISLRLLSRAARCLLTRLTFSNSDTTPSTCPINTPLGLSSVTVSEHQREWSGCSPLKVLERLLLAAANCRQSVKRSQSE
jgi:hypothetical protein